MFSSSIWCAALTLVLAGPSQDKPEEVKLLFTFEELETKLNDPSFRILDTRPRAEYERGHIPGAVWVDMRVLAAKASIPGALESPEGWAELMAPLGLEPDQQVVVYDGKRQLDAARLWWLLGYLGVNRVALLDGNFTLWNRGRLPVDDRDVAVESSTLPIQLRPELLTTQTEVLDALKNGNRTIVDARSDKEYTGEEAISKRGGHIPNAKQVEWSNLVDSEGRFQPLQTVRKTLQEAGVDLSSPAITHCQGGGRASLDAFVLSRLGIPASNYYLGWSEWGNEESCPIETGRPAVPNATAPASETPNP